ncbi:MAG TPA: urate hydroxylase PuuD [Candidatus Saccharimonadales bacterium]|nr:urate hydroxylase PuuD [Candidatus Saccharimonadales bacterium]
MVLIDTPHIAIPAGLTPTLQLLLRWVHLIAGITWVGLLYFFTLVNTPFLQEVEGATRVKVVLLLMPRALWWFRWASVVTVFAGIWYWMMIVSADAHNAQTSGGKAIGTFFGLWTVAFAIEMGLLMSPAEALKKGPVFGVIMGVVVAATAWFYLVLNAHGWESNRLLAIGIGGGLGWFMLLNVWGIIWRVQKKLIRWTKESAANGTPMPAEAAKLAQLSQLVSRTNFILSFPMLLLMAVASHYPVFGP